MKAILNIDEYINQFPIETKTKLQELREIIKGASPNASEVISYAMPAFKQHGVLVYFAGYKNHIGFYPTSSGISNFLDQLGKYKTSKGAIQFPIDKPLPKMLIRKIVKFRTKDDELRFISKKSNVRKLK